MSKNIDMVNHPEHYKTESGLETIDVIEAFTKGLEGIEATDTGNVIKYICRWHKKNGLEDLKKAKWYLEHLIKKVEEENNTKNISDVLTEYPYPKIFKSASGSYPSDKRGE